MELESIDNYLGLEKEEDFLIFGNVLDLLLILSKNIFSLCAGFDLAVKSFRELFLLLLLITELISKFKTFFMLYCY